MSVSIPFHFSDGDTPGAAPFNSNFDALATAHNTLDTTVNENASDISTLETKVDKHGSRAFYAYEIAGQAVSSGNTDTVVLGTEAIDTDSVFNTSTYKYIPNRAGTYLLSVNVRFAAIGTVVVYLNFLAGGAGSPTTYLIGATTVDQSVVAGTVVLPSSDSLDEFYITVAASGGTGNIASALFSGCCILPA